VDLNHIFLFIAIVSPLLVLVRAWKPGGIFRGWRLAALIVLGITALAWLFSRQMAGYIGGGAWFALLFLPAIGLRKASDLAAQQRYESAAQLAKFLQFLHPTAQIREQIHIFNTLASRGPIAAPETPQPSPQDRHVRSGHTWAVFFLIALNLIVFGVELWRGALADPSILHRLGALDPNAVIGRGEFWRLITALFLHYNLLHIAFNLFALYVIGPPLERIVGTVRFVVYYLVSGLGSSAGVILLTIAHLVRPAELIGASGSVMGIVGAWAGFLIRHRHVWQAKQRLLNILVIIAIQIVFDLSTPEVSLSAHLCGLATGFVLGLALPPRRRAIN
jgi:membrane associated rhomboid family serine protease